MNIRPLLPLLLVTGIILGGCQPTVSPTPSQEVPQTTIPPTTTPPSEEVLYLNLVWHQHQPLYYKDEQGVYTRPWARAHATKDYYDMAALLRDYPEVRVSFNLTPVLIRQLDDLSQGTKDLYRVLTEVPAAELADSEREFLLTRFFDANWDHMIARFPRYLELLEKRGRSLNETTINHALSSFTERDFRDLQIWWNLAWFDPSFLEAEPLRSLVEKGEGYSEADKEILFQEVDRVVSAVIPLHKELQDQGQIEVIVTPYAHPILPLLYASDLAQVGDPTVELPERFSYPNDAIAQVERAVEVYRDHYGRAPRGMWPAEGAVAEEIVKFVADAGFLWMASGEHVLAKSLGLEGFTRDAQELVQEADALYRPYYVQFRDGPKVAVVFRDLRLSDLIGFEYSGDPGTQAAEDFINRLLAIKAHLAEQGSPGPHLVSVILDGENAWEHYDEDGIEFLRSLYENLSASDEIVTITPTEYLERFPDQREIEDLWPGAWFSSDYGTWIGEPEENQAWSYLLEVREDLAPYDITGKKEISQSDLDSALDFMYLAEGSDWFWWYGSDQDSGTDDYFDQAYRALLRGVYTSLKEPAPGFLDIPIIPERASPPSRQVEGTIAPLLDGRVQEGEWDQAGYFEVRGGAQARAADMLAGLYFGYDPDNLYLRVDSREAWSELNEGLLGFYLGLPGGGPVEARTRYGDPDSILGYGANQLVEIELQRGQVESITTSSPASGGGWENPSPSPDIGAAIGFETLEIGIPFAQLGDLEAGDQINLKVVLSSGAVGEANDLQSVPSTGPANFTLPELRPIEYFMVIEDPLGDDFGPGSYTYPTDAVFEPGVFDAERFSVGIDGEEFVFRFDMDGPITNPWGSGINLSLQTFDVYVDFDPGMGTGARMLLEGRNAALAPGDGWDMAVWVEGWNQRILVPDEAGIPREVSGDNVRTIVDPSGSVTIKVDAGAVPELGAAGEGDWALDPTTFGYAAAVLSQEGFPSAGVRRVRDVEPTNSQWRIGGGPEDTNHTRIVDLLWPSDQTDILANYPSSSLPVSELEPEDFAQIPILVAQ